MGNRISNGFQQLPGLYLRDLRTKTRLRFRSILKAKKSGVGTAKKKDSDEEAVTELNPKSVAHYIISNPDFLDDLVKNHISQDRIKAWIKEPVYEDLGVIEAIDHEGNVEISAQDEAEEEEEEISISSSSVAKRIETEPSFKPMRSRLPGALVSKKFSKNILEILSTKEGTKEKEAESEKGMSEEVCIAHDSERKTSMKRRSTYASGKKRRSTHDSEKETSEDENIPESEVKRESDARKTEDKPAEEKKRRKTRGDSTFQQQMAELSFRQRKLLIITRGRLLYPEVYRQQELKALLERPQMDRKCRELESHLFPYTEIQYEDINKVFIMMCRDLFGKYGFPMTELCYFLTCLKANYHNIEYHNYSHALSHAQSMYWILKKTAGIFTELEMKTLMIASIAHDVGHPGVNEMYLKKVHCTLAIMYNDPILEEHHVQTLFLILQDIRCNIFYDLESDDYRQVLDDIKLTILATNLQKYKGQCEKMRHLVETGVDFRRKHVRNSLKALMMMACDLCSSWKRWNEHKNIIWSIYKEYFNQGDKEASFGITTPDHMLRSNAEDIPKYQTSFLENVVTPILQILTKIFPQLNEVLKTTNDNLECWKTYH